MPTFDDPMIEKIYLDGCERIARLKKENQIIDGALVLPFRCYLCDEKKCNFSMMTGDGCPICSDCFERTASFGGRINAPEVT